MGELANWCTTAVIAAEVAMARGQLDLAEERLMEADAFRKGAADRGESYLLASQELGISQARLIVAQINRRH